MAGIFTAIKDIKKGDEVFSNYGYDINAIVWKGREWYANEWEEFKANPANAQRVDWLLKAYGKRIKA